MERLEKFPFNVNINVDLHYKIVYVWIALQKKKKRTNENAKIDNKIIEEIFEGFFDLIEIVGKAEVKIESIRLRVYLSKSLRVYHI